MESVKKKTKKIKENMKKKEKHQTQNCRKKEKMNGITKWVSIALKGRHIHVYNLCSFIYHIAKTLHQLTRPTRCMLTLQHLMCMGQVCFLMP